MIDNKHRPQWMLDYSDGKSKCVCKNCFQRWGKDGALSLKQREQQGTYGTSRY